jgi:hypothetical protein
VNRIDVEGVFSKNETKDDIATADLRYLLAPFYLAEVVGSTRTRAPAARLPVATEASSAHATFLSWCERHEFIPRGDGDGASASSAAADPATARDRKVARFKRERAIRARLEDLDAKRRARRQDALLNAEWDDEDPECGQDDGGEDDAEARERWTLAIEDATIKASDAKPRLELELTMLRDREALEASAASRRNADDGGGGEEEEEEEGGEVGERRIRGRGGGGGGGLKTYTIRGKDGDGRGQSVPPEVLAAMRARLGLSPGAGGINDRDRDRIARDVFRPSHILPTMTVEEAGEMEYRELMERTARQAANAKAAAEEEAKLTEDEREARELARTRAFDEFKDDNPWGSGNSKLRPCS